MWVTSMELTSQRQSIVSSTRMCGLPCEKRAAVNGEDGDDSSCRGRRIVFGSMRLMRRAVVHERDRQARKGGDKAGRIDTW